MNAEQIIADIEWLEQLFRLPDKRTLQVSERRAAHKRLAAIQRLEQLFRLPDERPIQMSDWKTAKHMHDESYTDDPRFKLWRAEDV
jgi:hypothetical protein